MARSKPTPTPTAKSKPKPTQTQTHNQPYLTATKSTPPPPSRQPNPRQHKPTLTAPGQISHHKSQHQPHGNQTHTNCKPTTNSTATLIASADCVASSAIAEDLWVEREPLTEIERESRAERGGGKREKERKKKKKREERGDRRPKKMNKKFIQVATVTYIFICYCNNL